MPFFSRTCGRRLDFLGKKAENGRDVPDFGLGCAREYLGPKHQRTLSFLSLVCAMPSGRRRECVVENVQGNLSRKTFNSIGGSEPRLFLEFFSFLTNTAKESYELNSLAFNNQCTHCGQTSVGVGVGDALARVCVRAGICVRGCLCVCVCARAHFCSG